MATINFLYRSTKDNAELTLRLLFRSFDKDKSLGCKSGIFVSKETWDNIKNNSKKRDVEYINERARINKETDTLRAYLMEKVARKPLENIDKSWLSKELNLFYNPSTGLPKDIQSGELTQYFNNYIARKITNRNTKKKLITTRNKILKYEKESNKILLLDELNRQSMFDFIEYLKQLKYSDNTISGDIGNIRTMCRDAKYYFKIDQSVFDISIKVKSSPIVTLTPSELEKIYNLSNLPEYLDNARDWLIISCEIGQRVSDFMKFKPKQIKSTTNAKGQEISIIEFFQQKSKANVSLPLSKMVIEILNKRNGQFPRILSAQNYNLYIKEVVKRANISEQTYGSKEDAKTRRKILSDYPKYELITSHIGRRSFATNYYGIIPTPLLMRATGHKRESTFLKYIGKSDIDYAKQLSEYIE